MPSDSLNFPVPDSNTKNAPGSGARTESRPRGWAGGVGAALAGVLIAGCASLPIGSVLQAPVISSVEGRQPELQLRLPGPGRPAGGAAVRLWSRIENPNDVSLTIAELAGDLFIGDADGLTVDFPLGLPLVARGDTVIPLDVSVDFDDLPGLGEAAFAALSSGSIPYRLDGLITVDAGLLGRPSFGPSTLLSGALRVTR